MKQENSNALAGIRCPACESLEPFTITVTTEVKMYDSGSEEHYDMEWNKDSHIVCNNCGCVGTVGEFQVRTEDES